MNELKIQTKQLTLHTQIVPVDFTVENPYACNYLFGAWSSTSFYSHIQGYKLNLGFFFLGESDNNFTISCYLMPGEFDGLLEWPFKAVMKFKLLLHQQSQAKGDDYESSIKLKCKEHLKAAANYARCGRLIIGQSIVSSCS